MKTPTSRSFFSLLKSVGNFFHISETSVKNEAIAPNNRDELIERNKQRIQLTNDYTESSSDEDLVKTFGLAKNIIGQIKFFDKATAFSANPDQYALMQRNDSRLKMLEEFKKDSKQIETSRTQQSLKFFKNCIKFSSGLNDIPKDSPQPRHKR